MANTLAVADYVVFITTIVVSFGVGIVAGFVGVKEKTVGQYFVANRRLAVLPVAISLLMSGVSANGMLGMAAEMYYFGTQAFMENLGKVLVYPIPILLLVPLIHPLKLTSVLEVGFVLFSGIYTVDHDLNSGHRRLREREVLPRFAVNGIRVLDEFGHNEPVCIAHSKEF